MIVADQYHLPMFIGAELLIGLEQTRRRVDRLLGKETFGPTIGLTPVVLHQKRTYRRTTISHPVPMTGWLSRKIENPDQPFFLVYTT